MARKKSRVPLKLSANKIKGSSSNGGSTTPTRRRPGTHPCPGANCTRWCFGNFCSICAPRYDFWINTTAAHRAQRQMNLERSGDFIAQAKTKHGEK